MSHSSQTWYEHDQPHSNPEDFSTLEVAPQSLESDDTLKELQFTEGLSPINLKGTRFSQYNAPEPTHLPPYTVKDTIPTLSDHSPITDPSLGGSSGIWLAEKDSGSQTFKQDRRICGIRAMFFWLLLTLAIVTVAAAIALPLALTVGRKNPSAPQSSNPGASAPASSATAVSYNSGLAAIAFNDTGGLMHYRTYYQDNNGTVKESSWNSSGKTWYISNAAIGTAKLNSPLAAIVTGPQGLIKFQINLYAISGSGQLISWGSTDTDWTNEYSTFTTGPLGSQGIMPAPTSNVAAHWDRASDCVECSGTLNVVYQQQNGQLQWGNLSLSGWDWQDLPANPIIGSGLAIDMRVTRNARDMLLYYQLEDGGMTSLTFNNSNYTWVTQEHYPIAQIPTKAPIASLTYGDPKSGITLYEKVLSTGVNGTTENGWNVTTSAFNGERYPPILKGNYSSLATNQDGRLFLMQDGVIKEFGYGVGDIWALIGNVTTI